MFEEEAGLLHPAEHARGPWSDTALHGGPVAGILARAVERLDPERAFRIARLTVDLMRPAPFAPLRVETTAERAAGRVHVTRAALLAGDEVVALALASSIAARPVELPADLLDSPPPDRPDDGERDLTTSVADEVIRFHSHAVEVRTVVGSYAARGPAAFWSRLLVPLVAAEPTTPTQRAAVIADLAGMGNVLPVRQYVFPNAEVELRLHREPEGEWLRGDCTCEIGPLGVGLNHAVLADPRGNVGRAAQAMVISRQDR